VCANRQSLNVRKSQRELRSVHSFIYFYAPQLYRQVLLRRVLAMAILSVCLSVRPSQPGAEPSPGEIETSGLHHMVAWRI